MLPSSETHDKSIWGILKIKLGPYNHRPLFPLVKNIYERMSIGYQVSAKSGPLTFTFVYGWMKKLHPGRNMNPKGILNLKALELAYIHYQALHFDMYYKEKKTKLHISVYFVDTFTPTTT